MTQRARAGAFRAWAWTVRLNACVSRLLCEDGRAAGAELTDGEVIQARAVLVATGGLSYPSTGSTGDGWRFAQQEMGLATQAGSMPALTPIETRRNRGRTPCSGLSR